MGRSETLHERFEMKIGQKVKVDIVRGGEDIALWQPAKLLKITRGDNPICEVQFGEPDKVGYFVDNVPLRSVREFRELTWIDGECSEINEMVERDVPNIVKSLTNALVKLLPDQPFAVESNTVIVAYNGSLTMEPVVIETRTIGAFVERPGWSVTVWRQHPATRNQPEDVSDCVVGQYLNYGQAVQKFIETLFLMLSEDYWNNQADLWMVEQWEQTHDTIGQ